ncbi:MAG: glycoside hydrolase family 140 protein [Bacteroidales bacterium]|nr:glycoside hydrolase family 140 protein [Bacteroidales bacterium]
MRISDDGRHIVKDNGEPFFWLGDTAWELFHRLDSAEAASYLSNRAQKGFNVIQAVVLAEFDGLTEPNRYGQIPLVDLDPEKSNIMYFEFVDYVVRKAEELGMYTAMLPTWGDKFNRRHGKGPEVFTPENAYQYGLFLGQRYRYHAVIWVLGGDRIPEEKDDFLIIDSMARGLREGDGGRHLITYHPMGGASSSGYFHEKKWLDMNMLQSSHGRKDNPNFKMITADYLKIPVKPVLDGEPCYEDHPVNWDPANGWFDAFDSRRAGYWAMLAGACGHTYGNHNIWQMLDTAHAVVSSARTPWRQAVDYPGAFQAGYMRRFFELRPWQLLIPSNDLIIQTSAVGSGSEILAAMASDTSYMILYTPFGSKFSVKTDVFSDASLFAWWFNPRNCTVIIIGEIKPSKNKNFDPPFDEDRGNDWVLVIEKESKNFVPSDVLKN